MATLPPLNYIRSFEASARHLSFTKAAEELGMTQAAVSGHVRALEEFIGKPLFIRAPRSLTLTEVAASYLPALRQALGQIELATGQILSVSHRQEVTLACPASLATTWLPPRLAAFRAAHPETEVTLHATIWSETDEGIADLRISPRHVSQKLQGRWLTEERLALVGAPGLCAGPAQMRGPEEVAARGIIHVLARQELWEAWGAAHGLPDLARRRGPRTDSSVVALEMAVAGMGLVVVPGSLAEPYLARGLLVEPFPGQIPSPWGYDLHAGERAPSRASARLMRFLLGEAG